MYRMRRLMGIVLMCTILILILRMWKEDFIIYNIQKNKMEGGMQQMKKHCDISICTPCQYIGANQKKDLFDANRVFQFNQNEIFPLIKTVKLEHLPLSGANRIEKIIHQSWKTNAVPVRFRYYIRSFILNHLLWKYMFWTDQSTRLFIQEHYPNILQLYDNYPHPLNRPDAMRYVLLFHYGGVYCDLDMYSLHPLDPLIKKYSCFLGQEPHVHSIVYTNFYGQASNAFMACRKRHPFMKTVIENLFHFVYFAHVLDSTGPRFLTFSLRRYVMANRDMDKTDDDYVLLAPPEYFLPTVDPIISEILALQCEGLSCLSALRQWQCDQWKREGVRSKPFPFSFTNHAWAHTAYNDTPVFTMQTIDIFKIYPNVSIYE